MIRKGLDKGGCNRGWRMSAWRDLGVSNVEGLHEEWREWVGWSSEGVGCEGEGFGKGEQM